MKNLKNKLIYGIVGLIFKGNLASSQNISYVNNPNDPRLKAYQDSLNSYNNNALFEEAIKKLPEDYFIDETEMNNYLMSVYKKNHINLDLGIPNKSKIIKIFSFKNDLSLEAKRLMHIDFKYPLQKVIYKHEKTYENKPKEKPEMEIDKSGLFTMPDGKSYTYQQLIDSIPKMKTDVIFKNNFKGRERPKE